MLEFECGFCPFETTMRGGGGVCKSGVSNFCGMSGGGGSGNGSGNEGVDSLRWLLLFMIGGGAEFCAWLDAWSESDIPLKIKKNVKLNERF